MIINQLELENFGIYYGRNTFDFKVSNMKNIVLIGGENGAGKTTILEAIKLCLYGSLIMGLKTNTEKYLDYIKDKVNYSALKEDNQNTMALHLDLDINKSGDVVNYKIVRKWDITSLDESLEIKENNKVIEDENISLFTHYIRKLFSPSLFDFFLFNGEKVNNTIYDDEFKEKFQNIASNIFNLTLPKTLIEDLKYVQNDHLSNTSRSDAEKDYFNTLEELNNVKKDMEQTELEISNIKKEIQIYKSKISALKSKFNNYGGLFNQEIYKMNYKINKLEEEKEHHYNVLKNFYQSYLPFIISKDLLEKVEKQVNKENDYRSYQTIKNKLSEELAVTLENEIKPNYLIRDKNNQKDKKDEVLEKILSTINRSIIPDFDVDNFKPIHHLSAIQEKNLTTLINDVYNIDTVDMKNRLLEITNINNKLKKLNKQLKNNEDDPELQKTLNKIENTNKKIGKLDTELENLLVKKIELTEAIEQLKKDSKTKYKELSNIIKEESIPFICDKMNNVIKDFIQKQSLKKVRIVEKNFISIINELFSVENYISNIEINPDSFLIKLYDQDDNLLNNLSAGEQELVILALLWALIEVSKQEFPIIFDTLLGRIDQKHRINIINNLIKASSRQIIILSTDTEITESFYNSIQSSISNVYLLNKEEKINHKTRIEKTKFFYEGDIDG